MSITYREVNSGVSFASSPRTVNKGSTVEGDKLILAVHLQNNVDPTSLPSDFTLIGSISNAPRILLYEKVAGASEPASYSVSFPSGNGILSLMVCYSSLGYDIEVDDFAFQANASSANRDWPSVDTTQANDLLACFGLIVDNVASTPDAAMTERLDNAAGSRNYLMTQTVSGTGATGTRTATGTASVSVTATLALKEVSPIPTAPDALTPTAVSSSQINLTWNDNSSNETGFELERSLDNTNWTQIATPAANAESHNDVGLEPLTLYYYRLRAVNGSGNSSYTSSVNATTLPTTPTIGSAVPLSSRRILLTWTDVPEDVTGYKIERSLNGTTGWLEVGDVLQGVQEFIHSGLSANTEYWYRVKAYKD